MIYIELVRKNQSHGEFYLLFSRIFPNFKFFGRKIKNKLKVSPVKLIEFEFLKF